MKKGMIALLKTDKQVRQDIRWYLYAKKLGYSVHMGADAKMLLPDGTLPTVCDEWTGHREIIHCSGDSYRFHKDGKVIWFVHSGNLHFHWKVADLVDGRHCNGRRYFYYDLQTVLTAEA